MRLSFLNKYSTEYALPRIIEIMAEELNWDMRERWKQLLDSDRFLQGMHITDEARWGLSQNQLEKKLKKLNQCLGGKDMLTHEQAGIIIRSFEEIHTEENELLA